MREKISRGLRSLSARSVITISVLAVLAIALPTTFFLTTQRQDLQQRASEPSQPAFTNELQNIYSTSDTYGINNPNLTYPDPMYSEGDARMTEMRTQITNSGTGWLRTDMATKLYNSYYQNTYKKTGEGPAGEILTIADTNKLEGVKVLGVFSVDAMRYAPVFCPRANLSYLPFTQKPNFTLNDWNKVVDCVSKLYTGKVSAYEIWNEIGDPYFQSGYANGSATNYFNMLKNAYEIIKRNDPAAQVIGLGGMFINGQNDTNTIDYAKRDYTFAEEVKRLGGIQYVDAISLHAYSWGDYSAADWQKFGDYTKAYKDSWQKPVWITETGYKSTSGGSQSDYIKFAYSTFIAQGVDKIFWYSLTDTSFGGPFEGAFGIVGKPAQSYMKQYITNSKAGLLRVETIPPTQAKIFTSPTEATATPIEKEWGIAWEPYKMGKYKTTLNLPQERLYPNLATKDNWGISWKPYNIGQYQLTTTYPYQTINNKPVVLVQPTNFEIKPNTITEIKVDLTTGTASINYFTGANLNPNGINGLLRIETTPAAEATLIVTPKNPEPVQFEIKPYMITVLKVDINTGKTTTEYFWQ